MDQDQFPIYLEPSSETATLPTATFEFTLVNDTTADLSSGPFAWKVHKRIGDDWFILGPLFAYDVGMTVNSGESYEWTMDVDNTALNQPVTDRLGGRDEAILFRGLGAGTYAFGVTGWFDQPNTREDYKHQLAFSSRFDLEGDPLKLTPTETVRETDRSGDTLTVTVTPPSGRRDRDWYEFVVTQVGSPSEEPHRLIAEQVIRETPLRNALAHFEDGIRRVRVLTKTLPMFVVGQPQAVGSDKTTTVEYEGETYTVEVILSEQSETPSDER